MIQTTTLSRQGNSLGVRLPKGWLDELGLTQGDQVVLTLRQGRIEISRAADAYNQAMDLGRAAAARYRLALQRLAS